MSYDVYLENGRCPTCGHGGDGAEVFHFNLTHNLNRMVDAVFDAVSGIPPGEHAGSWGRLEGWSGAQAFPALRFALQVVLDPARRDQLQALEASNGWGTRENLRDVLVQFTAACQQNPGAIIRTSA